MAVAKAVLNSIGKSNWNYAGLVHAANSAGGPEKLVIAVSKSAEAIGYAKGFTEGYAKGFTEGAAIAVPIGIAVGAIGALGISYIYRSYKENKAVCEAA